MMLRLKEKYIKEAIPEMRKKFGYKNDMAVPQVKKIILNTGFGGQAAGKTGDEQKKIQEAVISDLTAMAGQKAVLTTAKKAIAGFKTRKGMPIGAMVTLRGRKMYDFLEKLIHVVLPRSRDFRGIAQKSLDAKGNLTIAVKEHIAFPEISPEKAKQIFGLEITIVTNARNKEKSLGLFKLLGLPMHGD